MKVVRDQIEKAAGIKKRLNQAAEATFPSVQQNSTTSQPTFTQPSMSFAPSRASDDDNKKAAAAAMAAKLAASASSAQMLTSVLSSLVAEEAASMKGSLNSTGFTSGLPAFNQDKRQKLEKPAPVSDVNNSSDMANSSFYANLQQPSTNMQNMSQANHLQAAFTSAPPPMPHSSANQPYGQSTGMMAGGIPYGYGSNSLPPPPPLPPHVAMGMSMPSPQPAQPQQQSPPGFYRPSGMGFYGQSHPSTPPPVSRQ